MVLEIIFFLQAGAFLAVVGGVYGLFLAALCLPFLAARRVRSLFATLPPSRWWLNYWVWMPLPAAVWGFLVASAFVVTQVVNGLDLNFISNAFGVVFAVTLVSLLVWPLLLLHTLPTRGRDWYSNESTATTALLVVGGTLWYFSCVVAPASVMLIYAGVPS